MWKLLCSNYQMGGIGRNGRSFKTPGKGQAEKIFGCYRLLSSNSATREFQKIHQSITRSFKGGKAAVTSLDKSGVMDRRLVMQLIMPLFR